MADSNVSVIHGTEEEIAAEIIRLQRIIVDLAEKALKFEKRCESYEDQEMGAATDCWKHEEEAAEEAWKKAIQKAVDMIREYYGADHYPIPLAGKILDLQYKRG